MASSLKVLPHYVGDRKFGDLLRKIRSPLSLAEVRSFLWGVLAIPNEVTIVTVIPHILGDKCLLNGLQAKQRFLKNLMGLWNLLLNSYPGEHPYFLPHKTKPNAKSLKEKILFRQAEIFQFYRGVQVGGLGFSIADTWLQRASQLVEKGRLFLESYLHTIEGEKESKLSMRGFLKILEEVDDNLTEFVFRMTSDARDVRAALFQTAKERLKDPDLERPLRLTDPCPCGNERKFKKCCWIAVTLH